MNRFIKDDVPKTQIAMKLQKYMDENNVTLLGLSDMLGMSYEYTRRIARGLAVPSKLALRSMATLLKWDEKEAERLLTGDSFRLKHGPEGAIAQEFDPDAEPFQKSFRYLDATQKELLLTQLRLFVLENRRRRSSTGPEEQPA